MKSKSVDFGKYWRIAAAHFMDRGTEFCSKPEYHVFQLYLAIEDIDHSKKKAYNP